MKISFDKLLSLSFPCLSLYTVKLYK